MAFIPGTKDFYISISDHLEWGQAHIVFGEITSWTIIDRIVSQPYTTFKHPSYGTIMRMLVDTVHFTPRAVKPSDT